MKVKASGSFLKKRTKKLLFTAGVGDAVATARRTKFFCFFLFTKRSSCSAFSVLERTP
jgi:hypothetical protein